MDRVGLLRRGVDLHRRRSTSPASPSLPRHGSWAPTRPS